MYSFPFFFFFMLCIPALVQGLCDDGWKQVGYHCFKLFRVGMINQTEAVDKCDDHGGLLATIRHKNDFDTLIGMINDLPEEEKYRLYWTGLLIHRRSDNGKFLSMSFLSGLSTRFVNFLNKNRSSNCTNPWAHHMSSYSPEPNNSNPPELCVAIALGHEDLKEGLLDQKCSYYAGFRGFFCEKKGH